MTPVQRQLFLATVQEFAPWVVPAGLAQRTPGSLSLTVQALLRARVKRGAGSPVPTAPRPSAPPEERFRQSVTQVSFVFRYGSEKQDNYRLTVAQAAR